MPSTVRKAARAASSALLLAWGLAARSAGAGTTTVLPGHVSSRVRAAAALDRVSSAEIVELTLVVGVDQALMDRTLAGLYGPNAPKNPRFLTSAEFAQKFDLAAKRRALKDFARAAGLDVSGVDKPNSLVVKVSGPAGAVEKAFGVRLRHYRSADGQVFRANDSDPTIPAALAPHLRAVLGLSNFRGALRPQLHRFNPTLARVRAAASGSAAPAILNGNGPSCYAGQCGLAPADIKTAYGLSGALNGTGQTVALLELDGYIATDPALYSTQFGLAAPHVICTSADGACGVCGPNQTDPCDSTTFTGGQTDEGGNADGGMIEVMLDIDMVMALAPKVSSITAYTALNTESGVLTAYSDIANDDTAQIASSSWGEDEESAGGAFMASESSVFQQMAVQGQSFYAAAGDSGAYGASGTGQPYAGTPLNWDPCSQPNATCVGGTSLSGTLSPLSITETVWNNGCSSGSNPGVNCQADGAGGGGIASYGGYWPLPSYQNSVVGGSGQVSQTYRNVPDVALNADPNSSPYNICVNGTCADTTNYTTLIGGTSAASPLWAAFTALVNQQRAASSYVALGFPNPPLYQLGTSSASVYNAVFNDVTSGNNGVYNAATGFDDASGWGSFKANALLSALSSPASTVVAGLAATTVGVSSVSWTWDAVSDTSYNVYYATAAQALALGIQPPFLQNGLLADATAGIKVFSTVDGIQSSASLSITTATFANAPLSTPTAVGYTSSATFTFAACPASPSPLSCSGYAVLVSSDAGFTGTLFSSASLHAAPTPLTVNGLSLPTYFGRPAYLNPNGAPSYGPTFSFGLAAVVPSAPTFSGVSTGSITFGWSPNGNPVGETYIAQASTSPTYAGTLLTLSGTATSADFTPLAANTSYYFRVQGLGGPYLTAGPQATSVSTPTAAAPAFVAVGSTTLTAQWSAAGNASDTAYEADVALNAGFAPVLSSAGVTTTAAVFNGLAPNVAYFARVRAFDRTGAPTSYLGLGSTVTLASPPTFLAQPFSSLSTGSFTAAFNQAGNSAGTVFLVQASTSAVFATLTAQVSTTGSSANFAGLWSNATYYVQVAALNSFGAQTAFSAAAATATLVGLPGAGAPPSGASVSSLMVDWSTASFAPGISYDAQVSLSSSPFVPAASAVAASSFAAVPGLAANTTYFAQVQALSASSDPNGAFVALGGGSTLANPVAAASFLSVSVSTMSIGWTPAAPNEGYRVDASTSATFAWVSASTLAPAGATSAQLGGLTYGTTYYARVGALNWQGSPNYFGVAGSTVTGQPAISTGVVGAGGLVIFLNTLAPPLVSVTVTIPAGAFPAGTDASAIEGFVGTPLSSLAGATSYEAPIAPLGAQAAFCVSGSLTCLFSGGPQPNAPVLFSVVYNPALLPPGYPEGSIQLMRYDPAVGQWTVVPSQDDATTHVLTAYTQHFSLFAPFFMTPSSPGDLSPVQIFPQPWELGAPGSPYFASVLTFSSLPVGAEVKLFTLAGELVWKGSADASGVATWDGHNRFGRAAASGTYLVVIESNGTKRLRRAVLIR